MGYRGVTTRMNDQDSIDAHIQEMRKRIPSYPYPYFHEDCPRCKLMKRLEVHTIRQFDKSQKIILYDKETGKEGGMTLWGPIEQCDDCGRKFSITEERGIEFLE